MKTTLVTGDTGYLGRALVDALNESKNRRVFGVSRRRSKAPFHFACDLTDEKSVERVLRKIRPDVIIHSAGVPGPSPWPQLEQAYIETTLKLIRAAHSAGIRVKIIVPSSVTVYGTVARSNRPLMENEPVMPALPYAKAKLAQERLALAGRNSKVKIIIARVFNLFGPDCPEHLVIGSWARQIAQMESGRAPARLRVGNIQNARDFVDVRDAAHGLVAVAKRGRDGEIYNICSGRAVSLKSVLSIFQRATTRQFKIVVDKTLARKSKIDPRAVVGSPVKTQRVTGWKPRISINKSLHDTLMSFRVKSRS